MINPLLYDNTLSVKISRAFDSIRGSSIFNSIFSRANSAIESNSGGNNYEMDRVSGEQQVTSLDIVQGRRRKVVETPQ